MERIATTPGIASTRRERRTRSKAENFLFTCREKIMSLNTLDLVALLIFALTIAIFWGGQ